MTPAANPERYKNHRFPPQIISHAVWLYFRLPSAIAMSRRCCLSVVWWSPMKRSANGAVNLGSMMPIRYATADQCHLDEGFLTINAERHYLWRVVDQDDNVLDILVQSRRNKKAAKKFFRKLLKGLQDVPWVVMSDKLKRYGVAKRKMLPGVEHRQSGSLNKRCENSYRPTRRRERRLHRFKSAGHGQRFVSAFGPILPPFRPRWYLRSASEYGDEMRNRFESWAEMTGTKQTV